jgi:hypothetical protein
MGILTNISRKNKVVSLIRKNIVQIREEKETVKGGNSYVFFLFFSFI